MPIKVCCPSCNKSLLAPDNCAGRNGKCPHCGATFLFPTAANAAEEQCFTLDVGRQTGPEAHGSGQKTRSQGECDAAVACNMNDELTSPPTPRAQNSGGKLPHDSVGTPSSTVPAPVATERQINSPPQRIKRDLSRLTKAAAMLMGFVSVVVLASAAWCYKRYATRSEGESAASRAKMSQADGESREGGEQNRQSDVSARAARPRLKRRGWTDLGIRRQGA